MASRPVGASVLGAVLLGVVLGLLGWVLPLGDNGGHAAAHAALGVPLAVLAVVGLRRWPPPPPGRAGRAARAVLLTGLVLFAGGALVEAVGAFGYDGYRRANGLALLHDVGVAVGPLGLVLTLVGTVTSVGVAVAARRGAGRSRAVTVAVWLAVLAGAAFVAGGMLFGY